MNVKKKKRKILESHKHYDIWEEEWDWGDGENPEQSIMTTARNKNGDYIGDKNFAEHLAKYDIAPELINEDRSICQIGWSENNQKYYGWSHRAIIGFEIGDMIFEENFGNDHTPFIKHGRKEIKNKKDARIAAIHFAEYVS